MLRASRGLSHRPSRMRPPNGIPGTPRGIACGQQETLQGESACGHRRITILLYPRCRVCLEARMRRYLPDVTARTSIVRTIRASLSLKREFVENISQAYLTRRKVRYILPSWKLKIIFLKLCSRVSTSCDYESDCLESWICCETNFNNWLKNFLCKCSDVSIRSQLEISNYSNLEISILAINRLLCNEQLLLMSNIFTILHWIFDIFFYIFLFPIFVLLRIKDNITRIKPTVTNKF